MKLLKYIEKYIPDTIESTVKQVIINDKIKTNYLITANGDVISLNYTRDRKPIKLKTRKNHRGYHLVGIHVDGKCYVKQVHRLVATAFIPNPQQKPQVNHIDGNKDNNCVDNLEWVTEKENIEHAIRTGLIKTGEKSWLSKLTEKQVIKIAKLLVSNKYTALEICEKCHVSYDTVNDIKRKKTWKLVTKDFDFTKHTKKSKKGARGSKNIFATIDENKVIEICKLIESNEYGLPEISRMCGVSYKIVQHIYNRSSWASVSKKYDFSKYTPKRKKGS